MTTTLYGRRGLLLERTVGPAPLPGTLLIQRLAPRRDAIRVVVRDGLGRLRGSQAGELVPDGQAVVKVVLSAAWVDADQDGVPDPHDNCPQRANADQADSDEDGRGDACAENRPAPLDVACPLPEPPALRGQVYHLGPTGRDTNVGSSEAPFGTFAAALARLRPGDELLVQDGVYTKDGTGLPHIDCSGGEANGTPTDPIRVRAEHERQAWLRSDGSEMALSIVNCKHWILEGFVATSADLAPPSPDDSRYIVSVNYDSDIVVRRLLLARTNRCASFAAPLIGYRSSRLRIEENEVYDFHGLGIAIYGDEHVVRDNYVSARDYRLRDPPACAVDSETHGLNHWGDGRVLFENNISEDNDFGIVVGEKTEVYGGAVLGSRHAGVFGQPFWVTLAKGARLHDVLIANNQRGLWSRAWAFDVEDVTLYGNKTIGLLADNNGGTGVPPRQLFVRRTLLLENDLVEIQTADAWQFDQVNSYGNANDFPTDEVPGDDQGNILRSSSTPPLMGGRPGECFAYVPTSSPMHGAAGGLDIGANVVNRYQDGAKTCAPVWDATTGRRTSCGTTVPGVNDDPVGDGTATRSCVSVHRRLGIGVNGCPVPPASGRP